MAARLFCLLLAVSICAVEGALKCQRDTTLDHLSCGVYCYRSGTQAGCPPTNPCKHTAEKCNDSSKEQSCCCDTEMCNFVKAEEEEEEGLSTGAIVGIVIGAVILLAAAVSIAVYFICHRRKKTATGTTYAPVDGSAEPLSESLRSQRKSVAYKLTDNDRSTIEYEDHSSTQIEPVLEVDEKQELIDSLFNPHTLPGQDEMSQPPKIAKLVTYGTTDTITICEDFADVPAEIPPDDVGFCTYMLAELVNNGPRQYHFAVEQLKRILRIGEAVFAAEPSLLRIQVPCTVYGDIHGQYSDLLRWFNVNGWPNKRRSLFLGDFVDRGSHGVEVVALMCCLKKVFPDGIYICRGNHEEETLNKAYSFYSEVQLRFKESNSNSDSNIYMHFKRVFMQLPLAALIGKRILGMHGGISPKLHSLGDIEAIRRPIDDFVVGSLACDLVWSDPDLLKNNTQYRPNLDREPKSGIGQLFSCQAVHEVCKRLNIDMIVRGHQAPLHGYARWADGKLLTLFSAPGYKGESLQNVNKGACMDVSETGELTIKQIQVSEEFRKKRIADVEHREQMFKK